eukprot:TRINITY_DN15356_c0_g1_i1.p1 TRINITY_DN15356_c0_g1~~TRINITY_DN15356_c0_g1_i1.p1  ORF type:complete len:530 (+),score=130.43 TRINITY_DN15356_c0_g1_i1:105-1694(+)
MEAVTRENGSDVAQAVSRRPTLDIAAGQEVSGDVEDLAVLVKVSPPESKERTPIDVCCVIDISWSMTMEATVASSGGGASETAGLSMLDVAKHAVRTIIHSLDKDDRLSLVTFCQESEKVMEARAMDAAGKDEAEKKLASIGFGNGTNLWNGLLAGFESLEEASKTATQRRFQHLIVLTDGETEEKNDLMVRLRRYKLEKRSLPGTVSAFGFGYEIDSNLLVEIAEFCDGTYAFIPDAGFVGTIFVNSISNLLVTMAKDAVVTIEGAEGVRITKVSGRGKDAKIENDRLARVRLGVLQSGMPKDIILEVTLKNVDSQKPVLTASLSFASLEGTGDDTVSLKLPTTKDDRVEPERCRCLFVDALEQTAQVMRGSDEAQAEAGFTLKDAQEIVQFVAEAVASSPARDDTFVAALRQDIEGQVTEALSREEYWRKWGRHYTPSVMFAHKLQQCNNFKDPGVQGYGSELFRDLQDAADSAFNGLSAPEITPAKYRYLGGNKVIRNPAFQAGNSRPVRCVAPISMQAFNNASAA